MLRINNRCIAALLILAALTSTHINAQKPEGKEAALTPVQLSIAVISSLTAQGELRQLSIALNKGLDAGLTISEEKEVLVHLYAYCGFPRSIQGLNTLISVLEERKKKGILDLAGRQASPVKDTVSKYQRGKDILQTLTGQQEQEPKTGYAALSPEIDSFLKEHLFADIFSRDVLDFKNREIATVSALISLGGVEPMMKAHMGIAMRLGISKNALEQLINAVQPYVGNKKAEAARKVIQPSGDDGSNPGTNKSTVKKEAFIPVNDQQDQTVFPKGDIVQNKYFSGRAWLQMLVTNQEIFGCSVGNVTFEPGVRNNWHKHPGGQILLVISGIGYYQERGKPVQLLRKGDVIQCLPNVEHWHGAAPDSSFSHIAITTNNKKGAVVWLEPVEEKEYKKIHLQ